MNAPVSSIEGRIEILLARDANGHCVPTITSTRPFNLPRTFVGKPSETVAASVGLLFSLCGQAQRAASLGALETAMGLSVAERVLRTRAQAVRAEAIREAVLRSNPDFGSPVREVAQLAHRIAEAAKPAFALGSENGTDLSGDLKALDDLAGPLIGMPTGMPSDHGVAELTPDSLADAGLLPDGLDDSGLAKTPTIHGAPRRTRGAIPSGGAPLYPYRAGALGWGIATVQTARGLLTHAVRVSDGVVAAYRITAPTEWNFHTKGVVAKALETLPADTDWAAGARSIVDAIDPCVEAHIRLEESTHA
jgi:coenzyme F420-reducing hydrogenase alpha subunit